MILDGRTPLEEYVVSSKFDGLPVVVYECMEWILAHGLTEEGLFRTTGNQNEILNLKKAYDDGMCILDVLKCATNSCVW